MAMPLQEDGYHQPLVRKHFIQVPAIADVSTGTRNVTARLRAQNLIETTGSLHRSTHVLAENTGDAEVTIQFQTSISDNPGSGRTDIGTAMTLKPGGGMISQTIFPAQEYMELKTLAGESEVRVQLESRLRWSTLGFDIKGFEDDPFYPTRLWRINNLPSFDDVNV